MPDQDRDNRELLTELEELRVRLEEAEDTLRAISAGEVDAVVISGPKGEQVYSLSQPLQEHLRFLQTLIDAIPAPVYYKGVNRLFLGCNRAFADYVGLPKEEIVGKTEEDLYPPDLAATYTKSDQELFNRPGVMVKEYSAVYADGSRRQVLAHKATFTDVDGAVAGMLGVLLDITERQQAEAELRRAKDELEDRVAERTVELHSQNAELRRVQVEIEESRTKYTDLYDFAPVAYLTLDERGWVLEANLTASRLLGTERSRLVQQPLAPFIRPENIKQFWAYLVAVVQGQAAPPLELTLLGKGGAEVAVQLDSLLVPDAAGHPQVRTSLSDITARWRAEEALKESEQKFQDIFRNAIDGILLFETTTKKFFLANPMISEMLGYSPEELENLGVMDIHPEKDLPLVMAQLERVTRQETTLGRDIPVKRKDGSVFYADITGFPVTMAGQTYQAGFFRDVTRRKEAEEALRESETKYRLLVTNIPAVVFKASADWTVDFFDDKIKEITGFSREEFHSRRKNWCDLIFPDDLPEVRQVFLRALGAGKSYAREYRIINSAGEVLWIRELGRINCDRDGRIEDVTGVFADITRRKQLEEKLAKRAQDLARANDELAENNREIGLLHDQAELLQGCHTLAEAYSVIGRSLGRLFAGDSGALFIFSASRNLVEAMAVWGEAPPAEQVFAPDECWALRRGQAQVGGEGAGAPACAHVPGQTGAYLCVPLMSHGEAMGLLHVLPASPDEGVLERKQQLALTVAGQLGLALANLKMQENLRDMAIRDPLTGLFNRRYLKETLEREFLRATRQGAPIALIMLDIDHFKRCNDTYGHEAGDVLLRELGAFLQRYCRGSDVACRYGGEEFVLTLPECSLEIACQRAEEMRQTVKTLQVHHDHRTLEAITLSFGVAVFPEHGENRDAVLNAADAAMYRAKQEGRDRVVAAGGDRA